MMSVAANAQIICNSVVVENIRLKVFMLALMPQADAERVGFLTERPYTALGEFRNFYHRRPGFRVRAQLPYIGSGVLATAIFLFSFLCHTDSPESLALV